MEGAPSHGERSEFQKRIRRQTRTSRQGPQVVGDDPKGKQFLERELARIDFPLLASLIEIQLRKSEAPDTVIKGYPKFEFDTSHGGFGGFQGETDTVHFNPYFAYQSVDAEKVWWKRVLRRATGHLAKGDLGAVQQIQELRVHPPMDPLGCVS